MSVFPETPAQARRRYLLNALEAVSAAAATARAFGATQDILVQALGPDAFATPPDPADPFRSRPRLHPEDEG